MSRTKGANLYTIVLPSMSSARSGRSEKESLISVGMV